MDLSFSSLFSGLLISLIGTALFLYGKKAGRPWPFAAGIAMGIYPFFISSQLLLWTITLALLAMLYLVRGRSAI